MPDSSPLEVKVARLACAIAKAEGYGPTANLPTRINNPGDLELGDQGQGTSGSKTVFASATDGWNALRAQVRWMLTGNSRVYKLEDTFLEVAEKYTGGDNPEAWASIVVGELGVTVATTLESYVGA